jgi:hypothetical protein
LLTWERVRCSVRKYMNFVKEHLNCKVHRHLHIDNLHLLWSYFIYSLSIGWATSHWMRRWSCYKKDS